jgi:hypothetical protein
MHEERLPAFNNWQEIVIDEFETSVDTEAFEAVVETHKVKDDTLVSFDELTLKYAQLPKTMAETKYCFPSILNISDFRAHLEVSFPAKDPIGEASENTTGDDSAAWMMDTWFKLDDQDYAMTATKDETMMYTKGLSGQELRIRFSPDTMSRFLTSVAAAQMGLDIQKADELQAEEHPVGFASLQRLMKVMGSTSNSSVSMRERLVWLPQPEAERALTINFSELESSARSARKLSYRLAWKPDEALGSDLSAYQTDYSGPHGSAPFFSVRNGLDFEPDELLIMQQLGSSEDEDTRVGAFFDADTSRPQHANVIATIKPVLDMYLARFAHLDQDALDAALRIERE